MFLFIFLILKHDFFKNVKKTTQKKKINFDISFLLIMNFHQEMTYQLLETSNFEFVFSFDYVNYFELIKIDISSKPKKKTMF